MQTEVLKVQGMNDQAGADAIARALGAVAGVSTVSVSLAGQRATVLFDEKTASRSRFDAALKQAGFATEPVSSTGCCGGCGGGSSGGSCG